MNTPEEVSKLYHTESFRAAGLQMVDQLSNYLEQTLQNQNSVIPFQSPEDEFLYWQENNSSSSIMDWTDKVLNHSIHVHHPHYMGHQVAVPAPVTVWVGAMSSLLNNGSAVYEMGMASTAQERIISELLCARVGYNPKLAGGILTSGGTLANLTALLAARSNKTPVWEEGTSRKLAILVSEEAHYCVDRAARIMGLGSDGVIKVPCKPDFSMNTELLDSYFQRAVDNQYQIFAVVGSACSTSTGSYDNLEILAEFAKAKNLWFHVDGAHGGAVVFSEKYRYLVKGIEKADSIAIDWHKMLLMPGLITSLLFNDNRTSFYTFQQKAHYLWDNSSSFDWFNGGKRTFECTKWMMSAKISALIHTEGIAIFEKHVNYLYDLGKEMAEQIQAIPELELALTPATNIVCFRYIGKESMTSEEKKQTNSTIRKKLLEEGSFYIVQTELRGEVYLRVSLMNPLTNTSHTFALLQRILEIGKNI